MSVSDFLNSLAHDRNMVMISLFSTAGINLFALTNRAIKGWTSVIYELEGSLLTVRLIH